MENWIWLLLVFFALKVHGQGTWEWVNIDCGSETNYRANGIDWKKDDQFIKTGANRQVSANSIVTVDMLNTLRVFAKQNKNCYTLPTPTITGYFIRAGFHYGNYDGFMNPPTFDLQFDGNKWVTVMTSSKDPVYHEVIHATKGDNISVCLAQTQAKQFPFISSLEMLPLANDMYPGMPRTLAWFTSYRYNYGAKDPIIGYPGDDYNRIWEPMIPAGLHPVTADFTSLYSGCANDPPDLVIIQAVEAQSAADTITLPPFNIGQTNHLYHVALYSTEIVNNDSETRSFDFYLNDNLTETISPKYHYCADGWGNTQAAGSLNVELRPTESSTLPPIISAIEVYTASDPLVIVGTSQDDLEGLEVLISSFEQLGGWSGDPCLPSDTVWQWVGCAGNDPPRVTALNLAGYGLDGPLPDFSQMQALEKIDLGNNSLDGPVPEFLGNLPNLRLLSLRDNNFTGDIPYSIIDNKDLTYDVAGNPNLHYPKGKKKARIIKLAVGITISVVVVFVIVRVYVAAQESQSTAIVVVIRRIFVRRQ